MLGLKVGDKRHRGDGFYKALTAIFLSFFSHCGQLDRLGEDMQGLHESGYKFSHSAPKYLMPVCTSSQRILTAASGGRSHCYPHRYSVKHMKKLKFRSGSNLSSLTELVSV
jgi:hypothetical protein